MHFINYGRLEINSTKLFLRYELAELPDLLY